MAFAAPRAVCCLLQCAHRRRCLVDGHVPEGGEHVQRHGMWMYTYEGLPAYAAGVCGASTPPTLLLARVMVPTTRKDLEGSAHGVSPDQ
jgi:hypothetical protein